MKNRDTVLTKPKAFAASFARAGARAIALIGRSAENLKETEDLILKINANTVVLSIALDVTEPVAVNKAFEEIQQKLGTPQVLVNNAGSLAPLLPIVDSDVDSWWGSQEVNLKGLFNTTKAFLKLTGANPELPTTILNLTSVACLANPPGFSAYSMSKLALMRFTAFLAVEHPSITSVSLDPGIVPTDMAFNVPFLAPFMRDTPELVGGTAVWLATDDKRFLSGRKLSVNWDVEEVERRKDEIVSGDLLTMVLKGDFGVPNAVVRNSGPGA